MPRRKHIRLPDYDYAQPGMYFVTVCIKDRACLLGTIENGAMVPGTLGQAVEDSWGDLSVRFREVMLDAFVVMPKHVHGVIEICKPMTRGLPEIVGAFKSIAARRVNALRGVAGTSLWQTRYYEHVVRNEIDLERIRTYIEHNPAQWELDEENPERRAER